VEPGELERLDLGTRTASRAVEEDRADECAEDTACSVTAHEGIRIGGRVKGMSTAIRCISLLAGTALARRSIVGTFGRRPEQSTLSERVG